MMSKDRNKVILRLLLWYLVFGSGLNLYDYCFIIFLVTYFCIVTQSDIVLLLVKINSNVIIKDWSNLKSAKISEHKRKDNK